MTIYPSYPEEAREMIMYFLKKYFGKNADLIDIRKEVKISNPRRFSKIFQGSNYKEDYKTLKTEVLKFGVSIPPLVNSYMNASPKMKMFGGSINDEFFDSYMNLSPSMIYFGTGINDEFADVLDSGILISYDGLYPEKIVRHAESFLKESLRAFRNRLRRLQRKK